MRCNNCGWTNPEGLSKCQKCNQILTGTEPAVHKEVAAVKKEEAPSVRCDKCGYLVTDEWSMCPNCGSQIAGRQAREEVVESVSQDNRKTVVLDQQPVIEQPVAPKEDVQTVLANPQPLQNKTVFVDLHDAKKEDKNPVNELNKTVLEMPKSAPAKENTRKTVVDTADYMSTANKPATFSSTDKSDYTYSLICMDGDASMNIEIKASSELAIKKDDVVLIGGLRYRID